MVESWKNIFEIEDIETMPHGFLRISRPFNQLDQLISGWALKCDKILVFEHEADDEVETTHVHVLMYNMDSTWDNFRKMDQWKSKGFKGNGDFAWTKCYTYDAPATIRYMTKGTLQPKYNKGYTSQEIEQAAATWVPTQVKKTDERKCYEKFLEDIDDGVQSYMHWDYVQVCNAARRFAYENSGMTFGYKYKGMHGMLVRTFCYEMHVQTPEGFWNVR